MNGIGCRSAGGFVMSIILHNLHDLLCTAVIHQLHAPLGQAQGLKNCCIGDLHKHIHQSIANTYKTTHGQRFCTKVAKILPMSLISPVTYMRISLRTYCFPLCTTSTV